MRRPRRGARVALVGWLVLAWATPACAYRPFDGTDAAVADVGEVEIELQPAGLLQQGGDKTLIAPATVINIGFARNWEAIVEGFGQSPLSASDESAGVAGLAASLKGVLRLGTLQNQSGPSIATEFGVLLPGTNDPGFGARIGGIVSQRWEWGTINLNGATALTRDQHADLFLGAIVEGPYKWPVRPVAEIFYENEFGTAETFSGLIGAIWQVRDNLSFDVGVRHALVNGQKVDEIRAGVTFGFPLHPAGLSRNSSSR